MYAERKARWYDKIDPGWVIVILSCVLIILLFVLVIELEPNQFNCEVDAPLNDIFYPQSKGWLGGNVSTSIELGGQITLWLFGETLVGTLERTENNEAVRVVTAIPHGSIALVNTTENKPNYYIRTLENGDVDLAGFFKPENPQNYYTTSTGLVLPTSKYLVIFADVHNLNGAFNGTDVILVKNTTEDPFLWKYNTSRIPQTKPDLKLSTAVAFKSDDNYVYIFGHQTSLKALILARILETKLSQLDWTALEFFGHSSTWSSSSLNPKVIINGNNFGSGTLYYHSLLASWYFLGLEEEDSLVTLYASEDMRGPWGATKLYEVPASLFNKKSFITDSAKSHPQYQIKNAEIVFSFDNIPQSRDLYDDVDTFRPTFVTCQINYN